VVAFGLNASDIATEQRFFEALQFSAESHARDLEGGAFERLVGVPSPRATVLGLTLGAGAGGTGVLRASERVGADRLELTTFRSPIGRPMPRPTRSNDVWFQHVAIVVSDMDRAYARLLEAGMHPVSSAPQTIPATNPDAGGIRAFYFRDQDEHNLEIIWFPPGKGDPRWHRADGGTFLGIDHSAVVSSNTQRSLVFYRDLLGFHVTGKSFNYGKEQEALSGVAGARVRITSLQGACGPGVELLEYTAPRDGRGFPAVNAADRVHWEIVVEVDDLDAVVRRLVEAKVTVPSGGPVDVSSLGLAYTQAAIVQDPDGHAVRLAQRSRGE
jgi:catechol 2,3-dioxygenase-like lactoylglutathione lyase family enzyme